MAALILPSRRVVQPHGGATIDRSHPLAGYAVAAWAGNKSPVDALGNPMAWVGSIETIGGFDGVEQYQTGANNSLGYWLDKSIGQFGTDDFFIQARLSPGANSTSRAFLAKGDTGSTEWMFGSSEPSSSLRFYGAAGAISAQNTAAGIVSGKIYTVAASRVSGIVYVYLDGKLIASDTSSTNSLSDSSHYLTIGGADYDGTTFDNTRVYVGGLSQVIVLQGVGGNDVARALYESPWQLFKPVERRIWVPVSTGGSTTHTITPFGAVSFSGTTTTTTDRQLSPLGSVDFSGTAPLTFTGAASSYLISPTGAVVFMGSSDIGWGRVITPTGSLSMSGSSRLPSTKNIVPEGAFALLGVATVAKDKVFVPSGNITLSGTAPMSSNTIVESLSTKLTLTFVGKT